MEFKTILYQESEKFATIVLNRPEKRNAISYQLIDDLLAAAIRQTTDFHEGITAFLEKRKPRWTS